MRNGARALALLLGLAIAGCLTCAVGTIYFASWWLGEAPKADWAAGVAGVLHETYLFQAAAEGIATVLIASSLVIGISVLPVISRKLSKLQRSTAPLNDDQAVELTALAQKDSLVLDYLGLVTAQGRQLVRADYEQIRVWRGAQSHGEIDEAKAAVLRRVVTADNPSAA